jgi:N-acetylglucosamine-6-phosphate deacetylase
MATNQLILQVNLFLFLSQNRIFSTLVTDSVENIKKATAVIKEASQKQTSDMAKILGIHLEGIFINPEKKGIHNPKHFLAPTIENYKLVEDDFIKIVTLAPEKVIDAQKQRGTEAKSVSSNENLISYLRSKNIKVQAGHCVGGDLTGCTGVTHLFNAMSVSENPYTFWYNTDKSVTIFIIRINYRKRSFFTKLLLC